MNKQIIFAVIGVVVLLLAIGMVSPKERGLSVENNNATSTLDSFAQCLTSKGLVMYGAEWCPHCKKEKNRFGTAFKYASYVECPDNIQLCLSKGVNGYPTWIDASSTHYEGEQGLEGLAKISGCELPAGVN